MDSSVFSSWTDVSPSHYGLLSILSLATISFRALKPCCLLTCDQDWVPYEAWARKSTDQDCLASMASWKSETDWLWCALAYCYSLTKCSVRHARRSDAPISSGFKADYYLSCRSLDWLGFSTQPSLPICLVGSLWVFRYGLKPQYLHHLASCGRRMWCFFVWLDQRLVHC